MSVAESVAGSVAGSVAKSVAASAETAAVDAYAALLSDADLKGHWRLDDDAANTVVVDSSSGSNNGTLAGGDTTATLSTTGPTARLTKALQFDGASDYVGSIGAVSDFSFIQNTGAFTLAGWVKMASATGRYSLFGNAISDSAKGCYLTFENGVGAGTQALRFQLNKGVSSIPGFRVRTPDNVITDTDWHHIAVRNSGASQSMSIFVDGTEQTPLTVEGSYSGLSTGDSTYVWTIGRTNHSTSILLHAGAQAEHMIFSRALTDEEISTLASGPS